MIKEKVLNNRFYVLYFCSKANLFLVYKEDFFNDSCNSLEMKYQDASEAIIKKIAYTKMKLIDNRLTLAFHSSSAVSSYDIENAENSFKLYAVENHLSKHFLTILESQKNLEFGKNNSTGCCEFYATNNLNESTNLISIIEDLESLEFTSYDEIKKTFFTKNNMYGFEPMVMFSKSFRPDSFEVKLSINSNNKEDYIPEKIVSLDNSKYSYQ